MSSEPRIQLEKNGTVAGELYRDSNGNIILTDNNNSVTVPVKDISTGSITSQQVLSMTTSSSQDVNQTTRVKWDEHLVDGDAAFSHDPTVPESAVTINEQGTYKIYANLYTDTSNQRTNPSFYFRVNGAEVAGRSGSAYARKADNHRNTSTNLEIVRELSSGDTVDIETFEEANNGTTTLLNRRSVFTIEKMIR